MELPNKLSKRPGYVVPEVKAKRMPQIWGAKASASALNWSMVEGRLLLCAIQAICDADCALMIAVTQDHTAVKLRLYVGKEHQDNYVGTVEHLESALNEAIDAFASSAEDIRVVFGLEASM